MQIDKENLTMIVALAAIVGSIVSAVVSALSVFLVARLTKKYEDRRHLRELAINTAYKEWEYMANYLRSTKEGGGQMPLADYILLTTKYAEMAMDKNLRAVFDCVYGGDLCRGRACPCPRVLRIERAGTSPAPTVVANA